MTRRRDIDDLTRNWAFKPGSVTARLVQARDEREVLQMRIDLGVLQMETTGRPDGQTPGGMETYLDYLIFRAFHEGEHFELTDEHCSEVDREFLQYYHRRICWLALRRFDEALADADHTLMLMDFVAAHATDSDWITSHEQYRPFVVFQRTQAVSLSCLDKEGPEASIEEIDDGIRHLRVACTVWNRDEDEDDRAAELEDMIAQLVELKEWVREHYRLGRTLDERLAEAVQREQYELAARLRDEIARRRAGEPRTNKNPRTREPRTREPRNRSL
ncbi:MAG: UvrB/UvrC motif-containing protein [Pirellulales bacterium]|nr:UvrB/UvrC motif-containing protein [Pirellulales bacterium]